MAKVESEYVKESERNCENAEEDVADGEVRNENVSRCHHLLKLVCSPLQINILLSKIFVE